MQIELNGVPTECEAFSVAYKNDMLDGVILDMPENYIFLSDYVELHRDLMEEIDEDYEHFDMTECEIDFDEAPHKWVIKSIERAIVKTAEELLDE